MVLLPSTGAKSPKPVADLLTSHILDRVAAFALAADPDTKLAMRELDGKRLRIHCTLPPVDITLAFAEGEMHIEPQASESDVLPTPAHALLRGTGLDLLKLLSGGDLGGLQVEGDIRVLQTFAEIAKGYRPTPPNFGAGNNNSNNNSDSRSANNPLENLFNQTLGAAAEGFNLLRSAAGATKRQAQEDLQQHFTNQDDLEGFLGELHSLRLRVDRLSARLDQHQKT